MALRLRRGMGADTAVVAPTQPVVVYSSRSGETMWDFIDSTANQSATDFISKYRLALGVAGGALLIGFLMFRGVKS